MSHSPSLDADLELAERLAHQAGELLLERFRGPAHGVGRKSSITDPVSDADRDAEELVSDILRTERPDDAILGEEGADAEGSSGRRWIVDPLDGTVNYLYGHPAWCVSVALEKGDGPIVGVVFNPPAAETFRATRGGGCQLDGEPVGIRDEAELETALVATGFSYDSDLRSEQARTLLRVLPGVRDIRRGGAAALDMAWLAAGRLDGYYERGLKPWDWAAGRLLVGEAGGELQDLEGEPYGLVAAGPALLPALAALVGADASDQDP